MRAGDYPPGNFVALPLPRTTRVCATRLYPRVTAEQWATLPTSDLDEVAHTLHAPEFEVWEVRDALDELVQVAAYGWPGYVDATLAADAHRRWRTCRTR